jgi:hypothetical protein
MQPKPPPYRPSKMQNGVRGAPPGWAARAGANQPGFGNRHPNIRPMPGLSNRGIAPQQFNPQNNQSQRNQFHQNSNQRFQQNQIPYHGNMPIHPMQQGAPSMLPNGLPAEMPPGYPPLDNLPHRGNGSHNGPPVGPTGRPFVPPAPFGLAATARSTTGHGGMPIQPRYTGPEAPPPPPGLKLAGNIRSATGPANLGLGGGNKRAPPSEPAGRRGYEKRPRHSDNDSLPY